MGADAVQTATASSAHLAKAADLVLPALRAIEALRHNDADPEADPYNDLHHALEQLLPTWATPATASGRPAGSSR